LDFFKDPLRWDPAQTKPAFEEFRQTVLPEKRPPCGTHFEASCLGVAPAFGSIFSKVVETTPQPCSPEMEEEYPYRGSGTSG
jgi:hypothetical protein